MQRLPKVFVARSITPDALERLGKVADVTVWREPRPPTSEEFLAGARDADGVITLVTDRVDEDVLAQCPSLRVVANVAVGFDNLDVAALTKRKIPAGNTPDVLTNSTADLTFALLLACARRVVEARDALLAGKWTVFDLDQFLGVELGASTLGIVGMGRIGQAVAKRALAFSMRVIATSRTERPIEGVTYVDLATLLKESDFVSLHVALSDVTRHLIGVRELETMKASAVLINTARGAVVDQVALAAALEAGVIAGAGLDVFEREPVLLDDPILRAPNCVVVPHIGSATGETRAAMYNLAVDNVIAGLAGRRLPCCVNPEVYEP
jgi:glyoxylate reductase